MARIFSYSVNTLFVLREMEDFQQVNLLSWSKFHFWLFVCFASELDKEKIGECCYNFEEGRSDEEENKG